MHIRYKSQLLWNSLPEIPKSFLRTNTTWSELPPANDGTYLVLRLRCGDQDEEPNHLVAEYDQLCPGGLDEGVIEEDDVVRAAE